MTDIVEWLRQGVDTNEPPDKTDLVMWEASNEIERLRALAAIVREQAFEIERLRTLLGKLRWKSIDKDNMEFRCDTTCFVMDEIRRAQAMTDTAPDGYLNWKDRAADLANENDNLHAEIDRLRANEAAALFGFRETNDMALEEIERLRAELRAVLLHVADLRAERDEWKDRWAADRRDHEATIRHFDKLMDEDTA